MKIALVLEHTSIKQSDLIFNILNKVASRYNAECYTYGTTNTYNQDIDYIDAGILTSLLLNSGAADFVITGCMTGEGAMISSNSMSGVICGYIDNPVSMELFLRINAGNAISIPFGSLKPGYEINLEHIFELIFKGINGVGYPKKRVEHQINQRNKLLNIKSISHGPYIATLEHLDKDNLYKLIHNEYFEENFFRNTTNREISEYIKDLYDAKEEI